MQASVARMGSIRTTIDNAWRDYEGAPGSDLNKPNKAAIRALGPLLEFSIARAGLSALLSDVRATSAELPLSAKDGAVALVFADPDEGASDLWRKVGAPGAGTWENTGALASAMEGLGSGYLDGASEAASSAADSEQAAGASETAAAQSALAAQMIADSIARYAIAGPLISGEWRVITGRPRVQLTGTGTVTFDSRTSAGDVSSAVETYAATGAQDLIRYPYFGDAAVEVRATITGTLLVEII